MMDHVRRLAPIAAGDATRAVAVPQSRFDRVSPVGAEPAFSALERAPLAQPQRDAAPRPPFEPDRGVATLKPHVALAAPRMVSVSVVATPALLRPTDTPARAATEPAARPAARCTAPVRPTTDAAAAPNPTHPAQPQPVAPAIATPLPEPAQRVVEPSSRPTAAALLQAPHRAPMSEAALALRSPPAAPPRPIVHVTIDRIEVRAPAAAPKPAAAPRTRAAAASVSLSDYLRTRAPKAGGGA